MTWREVKSDPPPRDGTKWLPTPGSMDARLVGCICAVIDNHHGIGVPTGDGKHTFWITDGCPVHAPPSEAS